MLIQESYRIQPYSSLGSDSDVSAKDIELCVPAIRPVDHMNKYGICQNVIIAVIHILCIMEKVFESIRKAITLSFLNGADSLSFLGIHGCINKKQKDVIEIVENCSKYVNNISNTKDIVEHVFENALPSDISALFTREAKI
ncbi:hypothetical protein L5515_012452 [Caenorhabditis briggsae]|uniref:Uncharacterized protein n=1 Tax=Caenorhabditis briggsae TaxID=6238 RepID=A0AAE9JH40_CAEBR|nr:hypothetical protein L5515_012452 [Caenorhabditis briggsae]